MSAGLAEATAPGRRETPFTGASLRSWLTLAVLILVGLYMFADRNVIALQTEPMRAALGLSDFQIGLVQGLSVALFAAIAGYPIAWLADRFDVRFILSASILLWCIAVAACGLARDFRELFLASALVGAGEAGLLPITYAMIPRLFAGRARITANALVTLVGRVASGGVIILSGFLVQHVDALRPLVPASMSTLESWRLALIVLALPGPLLAVLVLFLRLGRAETVPHGPLSAGSPRGALPVGPYLSRQREPLLAMYFGIGLLVFGMSALGAFLPVVVIRQMSAQPAQVGSGIGTATLLSSLIAILAIVVFAARLQRRFGPRFTVGLLTLAALVPGLLAPAFLLASTPGHVYLLMGVGFIFLSAGAMAFPTMLQDLAPAPLRARLISIAILFNITLSALAPAVVGLLSDRLSDLLLATVITATTALLLSAALMLWLGHGYERSTQAARDEETRLEESTA